MRLFVRLVIDKNHTPPFAPVVQHCMEGGIGPDKAYNTTADKVTFNKPFKIKLQVRQNVSKVLGTAVK